MDHTVFRQDGRFHCEFVYSLIVSQRLLLITQAQGFQLNDGSVFYDPANYISEHRDLDPDALFWWNSTAGVLGKLISFGGYTYTQQRLALDFYQQFIVKSLGPCPSPDGQASRWRSFMADDFTPIEFSWTWGNSEGAIDRRVRFSIEAISDEAGTSTDPWNSKATFALINRLMSIIPGIDLERFFWLWDKFIPPERANDHHFRTRSEKSLSCMFLAFELGNGMPIVKAYMLPSAKMAETGKSSFSVIFEALRGLSSYEQNWCSLQVMVDRLEIERKSLKLEPFMIATDCIASDQSRVKVYARTTNTSFSTVEEIMSIFEDKNRMRNGLDELRKLWQLVFSLTDDADDRSELPHKNHQTSGILYYFEARPGSSKITTKVYLPVRHYGRDDLSIATGLQTLFKERRRSQGRVFKNYLEALHQICHYRRLESATGLQTYISCKIENGSLDITSYLSPEIYHKDRILLL